MEPKREHPEDRWVGTILIAIVLVGIAAAGAGDSVWLGKAVIGAALVVGAVVCVRLYLSDSSR